MVVGHFQVLRVEESGLRTLAASGPTAIDEQLRTEDELQTINCLNYNRIGNSEFFG